MDSGDADPPEEGGGGDIATSKSSISCSICLELVVENGSRSMAKLQCGHEFHLDCIGSAFNVKGVMQCPNCRKIEKGQWLFANGCRSYPEFGMDDWTHEEDIYDLTYSDLPFGIHWCPFGGLTRVPSSLEERELSSTAYHDLLRRYAIFTEQRASSLSGHSCPYIAYFQHLQPSSLNFDGGSDGPSFNHRWTGPSASSDVSISHTITTMDLHYHAWDHPLATLSSINGHGTSADQASGSSTILRPSTRNDPTGVPRAGSFFHPLVFNHGSNPRAGNLVVHPVVPSYPTTDSWELERARALQAFHQLHQANSSSMVATPFSNIRRASGPRAHLGPSDRARGFHMFPSSGSSARNHHEVDNSVPNHHFYAWEQDRFAPFPLIPMDQESCWWGSVHQNSGGSDSANRSNTGFWERNESERASQSRPDNQPYYQPVHLSGQMFPFI